MSERHRRDRRIENEIARRMEKRQGKRASATLDGGTIQGGRVVSPDGVDMSHRFEVRRVKSPRKAHYVRNLSEMGIYNSENGGFVWGVFKSAEMMRSHWRSAELSQSDLARLMFIGTFTDNDGVLRHSNGRMITVTRLHEMLGIHRTKFNEFYQKLTTAFILKVAEDGAIQVNGDAFHRGRIPKGEYADRIRIYRDTVRSLYAKYGKGRSVRQLGIIYSVIPFLHRNLNIVCRNPLERIDEAIVPLTLDELAGMLGYSSVAKFRTALRAIEVDGQPVFAFVEDVADSRKRRLVVNPRVVFAGDYDGLLACRGLAVLFN